MRRLLLAVGVAVVAVVLLLLYFTGGGLLGGGGSEQFTSGGSAGSSRAVYLLQLEVEGSGRLLVNGTSTALVNSTKPFTAVVEALPEPCYALRQLFVNGSPVEGLRVELRVAGNTTVRAVFERPVHAVLIRSNVNASALVNGSLYGLPAVIKVPRCSVLNVTPIAPRRYMPLNKSEQVKVEGDAELTLLFRRVEVVVELKRVLVPVQLIASPALPINGTLVASDSEISVPVNTSLYLYPVGVDRAGCAAYNETHRACLAGWVVNGSPIYNRYYRFNASSDMVLEQLVVYSERLLKGAWMEVFTPGGPVRVEVNPSRYLVIPFDGKAEYLGDGWLEIKGAYEPYTIWGYDIELPPWRRIRIHAEASWEGVKKPKVNSIMVVIRNDNLYFAAGYYFGPGEYIFEVDSGIMTALYEPKDDIWGPLGQYFSCLFNRDGKWVSCGPAYTAFVPKKPEEGVKAGWLYISGNGLLRIRIEVLEGAGSG